jgi:hypothetical protein
VDPAFPPYYYAPAGDFVEARKLYIGDKLAEALYAKWNAAGFTVVAVRHVVARDVTIGNRLRTLSPTQHLPPKQSRG